MKIDVIDTDYSEPPPLILGILKMDEGDPPGSGTVFCAEGIQGKWKIAEYGRDAASMPKQNPERIFVGLIGVGQCGLFARGITLTPQDESP